MCEAGVNAPSCQMPGRDARSRDAEMAVAEMGGMLCDWPWGRSLDNSPKTYLNRHLAIMLLSIDIRRSFLNLEELRLFAETVILLVDRSRVLRLTIDIPRPLVLASQLGLVSRRRSSHLTCTFGVRTYHYRSAYTLPCARLRIHFIFISPSIAGPIPSRVPMI
jgi:hypothetical protein